MELIFRMAGKPTLMRLPSKGTLSVGRSHNADYRIEGVRVFAHNVQITVGPDPATITVTDVSQNSTGLVARGTTPTTATMLHQASTTVEVGTGILLPMEQPGSIGQRTMDDVLWLEAHDEPRQGPRDPPQPATLPLQDPEPTPASWPNKGKTLAQSVRDLWMREGIRTAMDLVGCYTSEQDLTEELVKANVPKADIPLAITFWKSAPRAEGCKADVGCAAGHA